MSISARRPFAPSTPLLACLTLAAGCFASPTVTLEGESDDSGGGGTGPSSMDDDAGDDGNSSNNDSDATQGADADATADAGDTDGADADATADAGDTDGADADADTGTETTGDAGTDGSTGVDEAPTVVDVQPADMETAVLDDAVIVIAFSEAMDSVSVEAALDLTDIGSSSTSWNGDNTELTITPDAPLAYATGNSPVGLDALEYAVTIGTGATDIGGTAMESEYTWSFQTAREITTIFEHDPGFTGGIVSSGLVQTGSGDDPIVGDHPDNLARRGFIGFSITSLPAGILSFEHAEVRATQWLVSGDPMPALGTITIHQLAPLAMADNNGNYSAAALANLGLWSNEDSYSATNVKSVVVTDNVDFSYGNGDNHVQFRLQFSTATDFDGALDRCRYNGEQLEVTYLLE